MLIDKMMTSAGVIFASPNYSFHVSAITKKFLDRLGFVCHRPRFFGKAFYDREKGWFDSEYFYPVHVSPFKRSAGRLFDYSASRNAMK